MASNISCFVGSLKNHPFLPGREQAKAQRTAASRGAEKNLMVVLDEPRGGVG